MKHNGYGVVYTPNDLSDFVADLLLEEYCTCNPSLTSSDPAVVLDPACGEGILLSAMKRKIDSKFPGNSSTYIGVDIENDVIQNNKNTYSTPQFYFYSFDAILPSDSQKPLAFWRGKRIIPSLIIANPPWSSEKVYDKTQLSAAGYKFDVGQYDSYVLFVELCLRLVKAKGMVALIIPDSIFSGENRSLRKYLAENTELRVIARLGEKLFPGINRATTVLIIRNTHPDEKTNTKCFRLTTEQRHAYLAGKQNLYSCYQQFFHCVSQSRFRKTSGYIFDIDTKQSEESLLCKLEHNAIIWKETFHFGRGVEISKSGAVVVCSNCGMAQGYSKKQYTAGGKKCTNCKAEIQILSETATKIITSKATLGYKRIFVGENIHRYSISGSSYIKMNVAGINYKEAKLYEPPKILIRKTGLGIHASIDYESTYISQTIYSCNYNDPNNETPLEYYLGVLNSRVIYYYYLKKYGENEWKSHPYLTKEILFSLPIRAHSCANHEICMHIAELTKAVQSNYTREKDLALEGLVAQLYNITHEELQLIVEEINSLPDLGAINHMKLSEEESCLDI